MNYDLALCGVGGQGILSIAAIVDQAAMVSGLEVRQPEVHGMAQRGGAVHAFVRIADHHIACDLIPHRTARMILSVEPMESLRYLEYLAPDGTVVTDVTPLVNIADYPSQQALFDTLFALPHVLPIDAGHLAKKAGLARAQNMVVLGVASGLLPFQATHLEGFITQKYAPKGDRVVAVNLNAFRMGRAALGFHEEMAAAHAPEGAVARVMPRLDFAPELVGADVLHAWKAFFARPEAAALAARVFAEVVILPLRPEVPARLLEGVAPADVAGTLV